MRPLFVLSLGALALACSKDNAGGGAPPTGSAEPVTSVTAVTAVASAPASASAAPEVAGASFEGTYTAAPSSLFIPEGKEYASVKQAKDDPTKHVGEGKLALTSDAQGFVRGTIDSGPAAPALVEGTLSEGVLKGSVRRKDPSDDGLTGTLVGKVSGDALEGTMTLSNANASILRQAKFTAKKAR